MKKFIWCQKGWVTPFSVLVLASCFTVAGLAIDIANLYRAQTQLQVVADSSAHAALYTRELNEAEIAKVAAVNVARAQMNVTRFGEVLEAGDIVFGSWSIENQVFTPNTNGTTAVYVTTERSQADSNPVSTFLLRITGFAEADVIAESIFITYRPTCLREGLAAEGIVDMQSNNTFVNRFCVHSNTHVELNIDNTYEAGSIVSMPDRTEVVLPASGYEQNDGLSSALRDGHYTLKILDRLDDIYAGLLTFDPEYLPDYITSTDIVVRSDRVMQTEDFTPNSIHVMNCPGGRTVRVHDPGSAPAGVDDSSTESSLWKTLSDVVIITDCDVQFGEGLKLENVVVFTRSTSSDSVNAPTSLQIGRDDGCNGDGGAQIISYGSVVTGQNVHMYGGQIIAKGDVQIVANATGIEGASIIAGGNIDSTSRAEWGFCGADGMNGNYEADYFRLAL